MRHALLPARTRSGETVEILPEDADLAKPQTLSRRNLFCRTASLTSHLEWIVVPGAIAARRGFEHARNRPRQNPSSRRLVEEGSLMQGASTERCSIAYPTAESPFREGVQPCSRSIPNGGSISGNFLSGLSLSGLSLSGRNVRMSSTCRKIGALRKNAGVSGSTARISELSGEFTSYAIALARIYASSVPLYAA